MSKREMTAEEASQEIARSMAGGLMPEEPRSKARASDGDEMWDPGYGGPRNDAWKTDKIRPFGPKAKTKGHYDWDAYDKLARGSGKLPFDDDLSSIGGGKSKPAKADMSLPYWIRSNIDHLKATLARADWGRRPLRRDERQGIATLLMLAMGDLMEKGGGLIWTTPARKAFRDTLFDNMNGLTINHGGVTRSLETGAIEDDPKFTGPVAEKVLVDALALHGLDEAAALAVLEYLHFNEVRLMAQEDEEEAEEAEEAEEERLDWEWDGNRSHSEVGTHWDEPVVRELKQPVRAKEVEPVVVVERSIFDAVEEEEEDEGFMAPVRQQDEG